MSLQDLRPKERHNVIDLVEQAGIDVSDWANSKSGEEGAARNPKYCYNWSFSNSHVVLLNIWYSRLIDSAGEIKYQQSFPSRFPGDSSTQQKRTSWEARSKKFMADLIYAAKKDLPIRVVICDGEERDIYSGSTESSKVKARELDSSLWEIEHLNENALEFTIRRGHKGSWIADQFQMKSETVYAETTRNEASGYFYSRSKQVRNIVLKRSGGACEYCGELGFITAEGKHYVETHHIVPLSAGGEDSTSNVIALCPNHHTEAHHSSRRNTIQRELQIIVRKKA